jgi:hypothetical protein
MKKFTVLALFGLLIMAFSATVYAQKLEFRASGTIDFDTVVNKNVGYYFGNAAAIGMGLHRGIFYNSTWSVPTFVAGGKPSGNLDHMAAYAYSRGILKFDAIMDKNLSGTITFEIDAVRWGAATAGNLTQASMRNTLGSWATDQSAVEVKNVYFDVGLPYFGIPVPMTVRVGAQPFGVRPTMLLYTDGMGITGGIKADPVMIIPMWAKMLEGGDAAADDADMYGLHVNAKVGTFTVGAYGLYYNMNTYPLQYMTGVVWTPLTGTVGGVVPSTGSSYGLTVPGTQRADFWWFGAYMDGKAGPVDLNFDFVYDTGKERQKAKTFGLYAPSVTYSGWASRLRLDFPWEKFNFGAVGMYATGADLRKTSAGGFAGDTVANPVAGKPTYARRVGSYIVPPGSEQSPASGGLNDSLVMYSCFNAQADGGTGIANRGNYQQVTSGAYGGTWFAKLYGSIKLVPWYKVTLQGLYIGDTSSHGNTLGTARKYPTTASTLLRDDKTMGWEFDLINEIDIYKNLKGFVGFGYLFAGDAMDVYNSARLSNFSPQNPWNITTRLLYTF